MDFVVILFLIILIEAITNILSKSTLFEPIREYLFNHRNNRGCRFLHNLLDCPYCCSVWVSMLCLTMFYIYVVNLLPSIFLWFSIGIVFHRLSNVLHFIIDRFDRNN